MTNIIKLDKRKHVYEVSECAGCVQPIKADYTEVLVPMDNNTIKHVALCDPCYETSKQLGII